jgi:hypothetical protein
MSIASIMQDQMEAIKEAGLDPDEVIAQLQKDGVDIKYGDFVMTVSPNAIEDAKKRWAEIPPIEVVYIERSIEDALKKAIPKFEKAEAKNKWPSKKFMDDLMGDLVFWHTRIDPEGSYTLVMLKNTVTGEQYPRTIKSCHSHMSVAELIGECC